MINQVTIAALLISSTILLHGIFIAFAAACLRPFSVRLHYTVRFVRDLSVLVLLGIWFMFAHFLEILIWAKTYEWIGVVPDFGSAFFLASLCYTTLGLGGLEIAPEWRGLPGANAANGFLLFGMSAAYLLDVFNRLRMNRA